MERDPLVRTLIVLLIVAAAVHLAGVAWNLLVTFGDIVAIFFLAWVLAFIFRPIAQFLDRFDRVPWPLSVGIVYGLLLITLVTAAVVTVPAAVVQVDQISRSVPTWLEDAPVALQSLQDWLNDHRVPVNLSANFASERLAERIEAMATGLAQNTLSVAQGIVTVVVQLIIVLIISFYLTLEGDRLNWRLLAPIPAAYRDDVRYLFERVDRTFGGFLRATLVMVVGYGVANALVMTAAGLKFVVAVSIFAGIAMVIPFVGTVIALIPPVVIAAVEGPWTRALAVAVVLLAIQQVVLYVVMPRLLRATAGIHPLLVFAAILVGAKVAGFWGAVFGVPVVGVVYATAMFLLDRAMHREASGQAEASPVVAVAGAEHTEEIREGVVHEDPEGRGYGGRLGDTVPARDQGPAERDPAPHRQAHHPVRR